MTQSPAPTPHSLEPGTLVGPWRVVERRDSGSYGVVYRVERAGHPEAGSFALKLAVHPGDERFTREAEVLQRVVHSSVPRFEDRGGWTGPRGVHPYVVMEWVEGQPLYEWGRQHPRTSQQVLRVLTQVASALAATHGAGGVHRDVKGDNVLVRTDGRAVLVDFGCSTYEGAKALTDTALPPGTSAYRTPEALRWGWAHRMDDVPYEAGPADDVYALGVAAYRLCTGTYPPSPMEGSGRPRRLLPPRELATVSTGLERLLLAALSEDRLARPPAASLALALSAAAEENEAVKPIKPTPAAARTEKAARPGPRRLFTVPAWLSWAGAAVVGGLVVVVASELLHRGHNPPESPLPVADLRESPPPESPDGGVGAEALASAVGPPRSGVSAYALGLPMPKTPFPGQRRPPCERDFERSINGACWVGPIGTRKPPCGGTAFDYQDGCYKPAFDSPRQPTSEEPR